MISLWELLVNSCHGVQGLVDICNIVYQKAQGKGTLIRRAVWESVTNLSQVD